MGTRRNVFAQLSSSCVEAANNRRRLIVALGLAYFGVRPASTQDTKRLPRIGVLFTGSAEAVKSRLPALTAGFHERGLVDGKTVTISIRYSAGSTERLHAHVSELTRDMDVIVATSGTGTEAVRHVTTNKPIVCVTCGDYVGSGFAANLSRPGGNVTGTTLLSLELTQKRIQLLREIAPKLQRMAYVTSPDISRTVTIQDREVEETGAKLGIETRAFALQEGGSLERLEPQLRAWRAEGIIVMERPLSMLYRKELGDLAMRLKLPLVAGSGGYDEAGALVGYGPSYDALYRRAGYYVDRILKGTKPGDLLIEQPTRFELVVNMKTAKALGITIPQSILVRADRVIE